MHYGVDDRMDCSLCHKPIKDYNPELNHLKMDDSNEADICPECCDKFMKWQRGIFARLFPTNAAKRYIGDKKKL